MPASRRLERRIGSLASRLLLNGRGIRLLLWRGIGRLPWRAGWLLLLLLLLLLRLVSGSLRLPMTVILP